MFIEIKGDVLFLGLFISEQNNKNLNKSYNFKLVKTSGIINIIMECIKIWITETLILYKNYLVNFSY